MMNVNDQNQSEVVILSAAKDQHSEASPSMGHQMLRCAQHDTFLPISIGKAAVQEKRG
jgi:hypothetical protein